jgi:hypothetical protein
MVWDSGYAGDVLPDSENEMGHATARKFGNDIPKETHRRGQPFSAARSNSSGVTAFQGASKGHNLPRPMLTG